MTPASLITLRQHWTRVAEYHADRWQAGVDAQNVDLVRESEAGYETACRKVLLARIVALLATVYTPEGVRVWLHGRHKLLAGERPLDVIADGRGGEVYGLALGLAEGVFV